MYINKTNKERKGRLLDTCIKSVVYLLQFLFFRVFPYGLAVRIPVFHPGGPGSTPGMGITLYFFFLVFIQLGLMQ